MNPRQTFHAVATLLALLAPVATVIAQADATTDKWYKVAVSGNEIVFVRTGSAQRVADHVQIRVKQNYLAPVDSVKKGKTYQSVRTDYRLDCAQRKLAMMESRAFSGSDLQGEVVQKASRSAKNLIWVDAPRATVFGEILDYGCRQAPGG